MWRSPQRAFRARPAPCPRGHCAPDDTVLRCPHHASAIGAAVVSSSYRTLATRRRPSRSASRRPATRADSPTAAVRWQIRRWKYRRVRASRTRAPHALRACSVNCQRCVAHWHRQEWDTVCASSGSATRPNASRPASSRRESKLATIDVLTIESTSCGDCTECIGAGSNANASDADQQQRLVRRQYVDRKLLSQFAPSSVHGAAHHRFARRTRSVSQPAESGTACVPTDEGLASGFTGSIPLPDTVISGGSSPARPSGRARERASTPPSARPPCRSCVSARAWNFSASL